jgi:DNA primase catalytic subunit
MMEERRLARRNIQKYNQMHRNIYHKIRETKNTWLTRQYRKSKELHVKHDAFHFHKKLKKLKEITNTFKRTSIPKPIKI